MNDQNNPLKLQEFLDQQKMFNQNGVAPHPESHALLLKIIEVLSVDVDLQKKSALLELNIEI